MDMESDWILAVDLPSHRWKPQGLNLRQTEPGETQVVYVTAYMWDTGYIHAYIKNNSNYIFYNLHGSEVLQYMETEVDEVLGHD